LPSLPPSLFLFMYVLIYLFLPPSLSPSLLSLQENLTLFDFELSEEDMKSITSLDRKLRYNDPGEFCKGMGLPNGYPIYA